MSEINYCQNLWAQFVKVDAAKVGCDTSLDRFLSSGEDTALKEFISGMAVLESELSHMETEWEKSFIDIWYRRLSGPQYQAIEQIARSWFEKAISVVAHTREISEDGIVLGMDLENDHKYHDYSVLEKLGHLEKLNLHDSALSDANQLRNLTSLKVLNLHQVHGTIANISALENLSNLEELDLWQTDYSGRIDFGKLTNLRKLNLHQSPDISDISSFSKLSRLEKLNLSGHTQVVDISALLELTNLKEVFLDGIGFEDPQFKILDILHGRGVDVSVTGIGWDPEQPRWIQEVHDQINRRRMRERRNNSDDSGENE